MLGSYIACLFLASFIGPAFLSSQLPMPTHGEKEAMCEKTALEGCLRKLQTFLRVKELPFTAVEKDLDLLCEKAMSGYNCSQMLYANADCLMQKDKDMIPVFTPMAEYMYFMLCKSKKAGSGYLRESFLSNSECILKHKEEIDCCAKETNISNLPIRHFLEESDKPIEIRTTRTCCPISRYTQCMSNIAQSNCGDSAKNFTSEYILRASGNQIQVVCDKLPDFPDTDTDTCPEPAKICSDAITAQQQKNIEVCLGLVLVLIWVSNKQFL
ncbi:hypothetical protein JTE90_009905 [Oedothorax gibbosus]|uniref:Uncharacterized protein n=1 Tax=Oedothorax gibbosus TaxID=931172 RepID=A0AAV6UUP4_9ARAC|nr:hypothetical protein JTE90_009905 [Oedothorax gibbosus]